MRLTASLMRDAGIRLPANGWRMNWGFSADAGFEELVGEPLERDASRLVHLSARQRHRHRDDLKREFVE